MSELLTGSCPNCGSKLSYGPKDRTVTCYACDSVLRTSEIVGNGGLSATPANYAAFMGFDNPESGVVFLENFFETYDWESYQQLPDIAIPEISEVIGNNKIKNGAVPETWYLDFLGLYVPVSRKFEGLCDLEKEVIVKFNPIDPTEIFDAFDSYRRLATVLLDEKESIFKALEADIKFAERFLLSPERLSEMKRNVAILQQKYLSISTKTVLTAEGESKTVVVDKIEDFSAYNAAKDNYANKASAEFMARGINAREIYDKAVRAYHANDVSLSLSLFESIRSYSDSLLYIDKLNQYFDFFGEVYRFGGRHFIYKREDYTLEALNLKKLSKRAMAARAEAGEGDIYALALYEIVNGVPAEYPTVKGIDQVITCYGSKLFFFKNGKGIGCYDLSTGRETIIDSGTEDLYKNENGEYECGFAKHAPVFYVRKRFQEDIKGCFGKNKGVKVNTLNPYTLLLVDMSTNNCRVAVKEMVEIKLRKDDKIFYNFAYKADKAKGLLGCLGAKVSDKPKSRLMVCDLEYGTTAQVLDDDCDICDVKGDLVFYTLWKNNDLNEDLHVYNMQNSSDVLIEKNIYEFFRIIDDKIYYTIGNEKFRPLVRANFDGSGREQVMLNVKRIEMIRGGWFYVTKGTGHNSVLVKIRADGKEARVLCNGIKKVLRFDGNYIYFSDMYDNLRVVRIDGAGERLIAEKVTQIFPADDGLYYCREEYVEDNKTNLSLYHMDKDGKNIRKIVFNVDRVQNDAISNMLYLSKRENVRFKVYKPGKEDKAHYEFLNITKFYFMKKANAGQPAKEPILFLTLGLPEHEKKKGCLARFKKDYIYVEDPIVHSYKNRGMTDDEIMAQEEEEANGTSKAPAWLPAGLAGLMAKKKTSKGCAPSIKKIKNAARKNSRIISKFMILLIAFVIVPLMAMYGMRLFKGIDLSFSNDPGSKRSRAIQIYEDMPQSDYYDFLSTKKNSVWFKYIPNDDHTVSIELDELDENSVELTLYEGRDMLMSTYERQGELHVQEGKKYYVQVKYYHFSNDADKSFTITATRTSTDDGGKDNSNNSNSNNNNSNNSSNSTSSTSGSGANKSSAIALTLDETKVTGYDTSKHSDGKMWFKFTTQSSGYYTYTIKSGDTRTVSIYSSEGSLVDEFYESTSSIKYNSVQLAAKKTYYICIKFSSAPYDSYFGIQVNSGTSTSSNSGASKTQAIALVSNANESVCYDTSENSNGELWFKFDSRSYGSYGLYVSSVAIDSMKIDIYNSSGSKIETKEIDDYYGTFYFSCDTNSTFYIKLTMYDYYDTLDQTTYISVELKQAH